MGVVKLAIALMVAQRPGGNLGFSKLIKQRFSRQGKLQKILEAILEQDWSI